MQFPNSLTSVGSWTAAVKWREEEGGLFQQISDSPYIINDIISTTLLTKQMHKSHRPQSIDMETFNHVLNNDYCSHNAIIIFSCWFELIACQSAIRARGDVKQWSSTEQWLSDWHRWRKKAELPARGVFYLEWQVKSGCQKMHWISAVLFISGLPLNKSGGTCIGCPSAFSSAPLNGSGDWRVQFIPPILPDRETI